jgi:hypothetical protein
VPHRTSGMLSSRPLDATLPCFVPGSSHLRHTRVVAAQRRVLLTYSSHPIWNLSSREHAHACEVSSGVTGRRRGRGRVHGGHRHCQCDSQLLCRGAFYNVGLAGRLVQRWQWSRCSASSARTVICMTERFIANIKEAREGRFISPKLNALFVKVVARLLPRRLETHCDTCSFHSL